MTTDQVLEMMLETMKNQSSQERLALKQTAFQEWLDETYLSIADTTPKPTNQETFPVLFEEFLKANVDFNALDESEKRTVLEIEYGKIIDHLVSWQNKRQKLMEEAALKSYTESDKLLLDMILDAYREFGIENPSIIMDRIKIHFRKMGKSDFQVILSSLLSLLLSLESSSVDVFAIDVQVLEDL